MAKIPLSILLTAVLLGGVACDYLCIIQQLITVTPDHFFSNPTTACNNVEEKFDMVRKNLKDCTRHPIDLSPLKSLHKDFCNPRSDYKQNFNRQEKCLADNVPNIRICLDNMSFSPKAILGGSLRDMCKSLSEDTASCMNDKVGAPCGDEGLLVYERITKSSEPFFTGICLEAAGVQADHHDDSDSRIEVSTEDGMIEAGFAEAEYAEGADDRYAVMSGSLGAPSTDLVLIGSLLLCFLFTTRLLG